MSVEKKHIDFRRVLGRLSLVFDEWSLSSYLDETIKDANCLLCYAYIDSMAGMTYEVLGAAFYYKGDFYFVGERKGLGFKIRAESVTEEQVIPVRNVALRQKYNKIIEDIDNLYDSNENIREMRRIRRLDKFRHPIFPDDVLVTLYSQKYGKFEGVWVKVEKKLETQEGEEEVFAGKLLNEPNNDYGIHRGEEIRFLYHKIDDDIVLVYSPDFNELFKW